MNKEIDENLHYVLKFQKINLTNICKKLHIAPTNVYSGRISKEKAKMIREEIESEIAKLYLKLDIEGIDIKDWKVGE